MEEVYLRVPISEKVSRWLAAKSPKKSRIVLSQKNIYIFPTSEGFAFLALLILMFLTAINYQNSLIYLLAFFLIVIFFMSIWMCFLNMSGLIISSLETGCCHEGQLAPYQIKLEAKKGIPLGLSIGFSKESLNHVELSLNSQVVTLTYNGLQRGRHAVPRIRLESRYPFGLIRSWTWLKLDGFVFVYPKAVKAHRVSSFTDRQSSQAAVKLSESLDDIKPYQAGDSSQRILWKKYAATDSLQIKAQEQAKTNSMWLTLDDYESVNIEDKLMNLSFDVCFYSSSRYSFGLDLPGLVIPFGVGDAHQRACLEALSLYKLNPVTVALDNR